MVDRLLLAIEAEVAMVSKKLKPNMAVSKIKNTRFSIVRKRFSKTNRRKELLFLAVFFSLIVHLIGGVYLLNLPTHEVNTVDKLRLELVFRPLLETKRDVMLETSGDITPDNELFVSEGPITIKNQVNNLTEMQEEKEDTFSERILTKALQPNIVNKFGANKKGEAGYLKVKPILKPKIYSQKQKTIKEMFVKRSDQTSAKNKSIIASHKDDLRKHVINNDPLALETSSLKENKTLVNVLLNKEVSSPDSKIKIRPLKGKAAKATSNQYFLEKAVPSAENTGPRYPEVAIRKRLQGRVVLDVEVLESGHVGNIKVYSPSKHSVLNQSALQAVSKWRFEPGVKQGMVVRSWVRVPVKFKLDNW